VLVLLGLFAVVSWALTDYAFHATGDDAFCTSCHTMEPMGQAYRRDVHGGDNPMGTEALCVDCHLSHDNPLAYFYTKAKFGIHDVYAQTFKDLDAIDWQAMRKRREEYVFDSGCMKCHGALETAPRSNNKAFVAHKPYFLGRTEKQCVTCHEHVGHEDLTAALDAQSDKGDGK